jgi:hypothetical protein
MVFHWRLHDPRKDRFKVSHLCYAWTTQPQYQAVVKLLGSFRLTTGNRHLHRYCIFTERVLETVFHSLRHSCTSELTRQGITLYYSFNVGPFLLPVILLLGCLEARRMASLLSRGYCHALLRDEVAFYDANFSVLFTVSYNRPNPFRIRLLGHGTLGRL